MCYRLNPAPVNTDYSPTLVVFLMVVISLMAVLVAVSSFAWLAKAVLS